MSPDPRPGSSGSLPYPCTPLRSLALVQYGSFRFLCGCHLVLLGRDVVDDWLIVRRKTGNSILSGNLAQPHCLGFHLALGVRGEVAGAIARPFGPSAASKPFERSRDLPQDCVASRVVSSSKSPGLCNGSADTDHGGILGLRAIALKRMPLHCFHRLS